MARKDSLGYVCGGCGAASASWSGRCYACGEWNTLEQQSDVAGVVGDGRELTATALGDARLKDNPRHVSGIGEIDDVMGGGIVPGSVNLIAGQPGIGKSTLLLQLANALAAREDVLYVSGEESAHQVGARAGRLGVAARRLLLATSNVTEDIAATIASSRHKLVIVDSIQAVAVNGVAAAAGTVAQITNSARLLTIAAKQSNTAIILVGHVTKEGAIAGPKVLEHVVDVVLQLEGDRYGGFKVLRAIKNRYGPTTEAGIFEMTGKGLVPVANPSAALLAERQATDGSVVLATLEGTRPLLVEVQALVNRAGYGYPRRTASGIDPNRVNLLIAMLERRTKLNLADQDVYVNIVGGIRVGEPAADLAVVMAIASASKAMRLKPSAVVFGELGLSGEVRHVPCVDKRVAEAKKLGFKLFIGPNPKGVKVPAGYVGVGTARDALNMFLEKV